MSETSLPKRIEKILRDNSGKKFTVSELAEKFVTEFSDAASAIKKRSSENLSEKELVRKRTYASIGKIVDSSGGEITSEGLYPTKYSCIGSDGGDEMSEAEICVKFKGFFEGRMGGKYSQIISHSKSSNNNEGGGNKWLHPDIVGLEDLSKDWRDETKEYSQEFGDRRLRLWSFEVKKEINRSNVRYYFFQAVANSSWAHYGYLVGNLKQNALNALEELEILSSLHGIGFIQYNPNEPEGCAVAIQAKEKTNVDWETVNRILDENNSDFANFMENVSHYSQKGRFIKGEK